MAPYIAINLRNTRGSFVSKSASSRCFRVQNSYRSADVLLGNFCLLTRRFSTCLPQLYIQHTYVLGLTSKPLHLATLYVPPPREICPPLRCVPRLSVPLLLFTTTPPRAILVRTHTSQSCLVISLFGILEVVVVVTRGGTLALVALLRTLGFWLHLFWAQELRALPILEWGICCDRLILFVVNPVAGAGLHTRFGLVSGEKRATNKGWHHKHTLGMFFEHCVLLSHKNNMCCIFIECTDVVRLSRTNTI